jgi:hypothetical protein
MPSSAVQSSLLQLAADLTAALGKEKVLLRRVSYDPAFFGTFQFEFAKEHKRARVTWDGRERVLTLEVASVQNESQHANWQVVHESRQESPESVFSNLQASVLGLLP